MQRECAQFYIDDDEFNQNIKLSFIIHETAINLIKSPKIGESFFHLKKKFLQNNVVLSKNQLKAICLKSVTNALSQYRQIVQQEDIETFIDNYLIRDERKLLKSIKSGDLIDFYPYSNPLHLKIANFKKQKVDVGFLRKEIASLCQKDNLQDTHQLTRILKGTKESQVINYDKVYLSEPRTNLGKFLKYKLINLKTKTKLGDFIKKIIKSHELQNAMDNMQEEFRFALASNIKKNLNIANSEHVVRSTLPKYFDYTIKQDEFTDLSNELIVLGRLMTTSLKRTYKNEEGQSSILGNTQSSFFRKVNLLKAELMETQLLYETTGARSDYVDIETQGNGGAYKNIGLTIKAIKQKLGIQDKVIVQWILEVLEGKQDIFPQDYTSKHKSELEEFISTLTYLLFGTEAVRNPASLIIHRMMLELIINEQGEKWNFWNVFTHEENIQKKEVVIEEVVSGGSMPMSQKRIDNPDIGAVDVSRFMHKIFQTTMKYSYDKSSIDPAFSNKEPAYELLKRMINLEAEIIKDWMGLKGVNSQAALYEKLLEACEKWYGIAPMKQLIMAGVDFNFNDKDLKNILDLSVKKLSMLREILENHSTQVQFEQLYKAEVALDTIIEIYDNGTLKDLSNELIFTIINEDQANFEDIWLLFQYGMTVALLSDVYNTENDTEHGKFQDFLKFLSDEDISLEDDDYPKISEIYDEVISDIGGPFDEQEEGCWRADIYDRVKCKLTGEDYQSDSTSSSCDL